MNGRLEKQAELMRLKAKATQRALRGRPSLLRQQAESRRFNDRMRFDQYAVWDLSSASERNRLIHAVYQHEISRPHVPISSRGKGV